MQQNIGYQAQVQPQARQAGSAQEIKFYKSGIFLFASAAGRTQRDTVKMLEQGWRIKHATNLGMDLLLRRIIMVVYERA